MPERAARRSTACTPTSARTTSCTASTSRCRAGELTVLLGRNGAGKTTTLRTIMGLWSRAAGEVRFDGARHRRLATPDIARAGIAYVPETMGIFADLTVRENLLLGARERAAGRGAARLDLRLLPGAEEVLDASRPACSRAGRSRCWRSRAPSSSRAALLLIDEPTKGLAPAIIDNMIARLPRAQARPTPRSCWWSRTSASPRRSATPSAVMDDGRIVHAGAHGGARRRRRRCSSACSACRWRRTNERDRRDEPRRCPTRRRLAAAAAGAGAGARSRCR